MLRTGWPRAECPSEGRIRSVERSRCERIDGKRQASRALAIRGDLVCARSRHPKILCASEKNGATVERVAPRLEACCVISSCAVCGLEGASLFEPCFRYGFRGSSFISLLREFEPHGGGDFRRVDLMPRSGAREIRIFRERLPRVVTGAVEVRHKGADYEKALEFRAAHPLNRRCTDFFVVHCCRAP